MLYKIINFNDIQFNLTKALQLYKKIKMSSIDPKLKNNLVHLNATRDSGFSETITEDANYDTTFASFMNLDSKDDSIVSSNLTKK